MKEKRLIGGYAVHDGVYLRNYAEKSDFLKAVEPVGSDQCVAIFRSGERVELPVEMEKELRSLIGTEIGIVPLDGFNIRRF